MNVSSSTIKGLKVVEKFENSFGCRMHVEIAADIHHCDAENLFIAKLRSLRNTVVKAEYYLLKCTTIALIFIVDFQLLKN